MVVLEGWNIGGGRSRRRALTRMRPVIDLVYSSPKSTNSLESRVE